jgi:hypothetical protein
VQGWERQGVQGNNKQSKQERKATDIIGAIDNIEETGCAKREKKSMQHEQQGERGRGRVGNMNCSKNELSFALFKTKKFYLLFTAGGAGPAGCAMEENIQLVLK